MNKILELEEKVKSITKEIEELKLSAKEEEFKVGDYAFVLGNTGGGLGFYTGNGLSDLKLYKLLEIDNSKNPTGNSQKESHFMVQSGCSFYCTDKKWVKRKATKEEIESHLIKEAEKKGFVKGAKAIVVDGVSNGRYCTTTKEWFFPRAGKGEREINEFKVIENKLLFHLSGIDSDVFYTEEAIKLIPSHPSITLNGNKVEFFSDHIKVGCKTIYSDSIKRLYWAITQWNSNTIGVPIHGLDFTSDGAIVSANDLRLISEHYSK